MFGIPLLGNRKRAPALVTSGHFELERDEHLADFEYTIAEHILELLHAEVPAALRGSGIASILAKTALDWAREHQMRVDVVCPFTAEYLGTHPEYSDLVLR